MREEWRVEIYVELKKKSSSQLPESVFSTGYWLLATGYWLLATGYRLPATGYWLLATGYRLPATDFQPTAHR